MCQGMLVAAFILQLLLSTAEVSPHCTTAFLNAAANGDTAIVARCLLNETWSCIDQLGRTPLHIAALHGNIQVAAALLKAGAGLISDGLGRAPLHYSASAGYSGMCSLLIQANAYLEARDETRRTPLHFAAQSGHAPVVGLLLNFGADIGAVDGVLRSALHLSATGDEMLNTSQLLVARGCDITLADITGFTALHAACNGGQINTAKFLTRSGASIMATDAAGFNALFYAAAGGFADLTAFLVGSFLNAAVIPPADPSKFISSDSGKATILGMQAFVWVPLVIILLSCCILVPAIGFSLRLNKIRKPYMIAEQDKALAEFMEEVFVSLVSIKSAKTKLEEDWAKNPGWALNDLHRVKKKW